MAVERTEDSPVRALRGLSAAPVSIPPRVEKQESAAERPHLALAEIAEEAQAALKRPVPDTFVAHLAETTGGVPWLVQLVLSTANDNDGADLLFSAVPPEAIDRLGYVLDTTHADLRELLLALAVGFDLSGRLPTSLESKGAEIDELMSQARADGLVLPDGQLVPLVHQALLQSTPAYRVHALQRSLVDCMLTDGLPLDDVAEGLVRGGLKDPRVAHSLERAADSALASRPATASTLYDEAAAAGCDELSTAARRAQAASALGDLDAAARILDDLLAHADAPDLARAIDVAAAVWAQRGMLQRSAELYRHLGAARVGTSAALAAVCLLGVGDLEAAEEMLESAEEDGSPTLLSVAISLMGEGLRDSVKGPVSGALPALIRASDMMTAAGAVVPVPEYPAVLASLVALHSGELAVVDSVLDRAIAGNQGGAVALPRLLLFRAWVAMQHDQPDRARTAIQEAMTDARGLAPRDELLYRALQVGFARRADDGPALVHAWQQARESILHVPIDLYSLLPLGELVISANRLRDSSWLEAPLTDAWALLASLGDPVLWSVPLHWSAAQSAILVDRPAELAPHASALVRASAVSRPASVLAAAGRAWVAVRAGRFEVAAVEDAARGLASIGLGWDGARLAGHAAARAEERRDMARLLACARSLHPGAAEGRTVAGAPRPTEPTARAGAGVGRDGSGLSAREREVAGLVLEGNTYEEIGEALFISPRTVEHHVARIRQQLGVSSRSEMLAELRFLLTDNG